MKISNTGASGGTNMVAESSCSYCYHVRATLYYKRKAERLVLAINLFLLISLLIFLCCLCKL